MELKGAYFEAKIYENEELNLTDLREVYFKNLGATPVAIGSMILQPYESAPPIALNITLTGSVNIEFDTSESDDTNLYIRAVKVTGCICRE